MSGATYGLAIPAYLEACHLYAERNRATRWLMRASCCLSSPTWFPFRRVSSSDCPIPRGVGLRARPVGGKIRLRTIELISAEVTIGACRSARYPFAIRLRVRDGGRGQQQDCDETCGPRCHTASRPARTGMPSSSVRTIPAHVRVDHAFDHLAVAAPTFVQASPVAIPAALSVHLPKQFAALSSHRQCCASEGELRSTPVPMSAIAKKRCRVMIGPPDKGSGRPHPSPSTDPNPASGAQMPTGRRCAPATRWAACPL